MVTQKDDSPEPDDLSAWRCLVDGDRLGECSPESIVAALQKLGPNGERRVLNALMQHVSDLITNRLRKRVGFNHADRGMEIIESAHGQLIEAILSPDSADGQGLEVAFNARIDFRMGDAIRRGRIRSDRYPSAEDMPALAHASGDGERMIEGHALVEQILDRIGDDRKRLAWRLHMDGVPQGGVKGLSIAKLFGVSTETVGKWINEVRDLLKEILGDQ